MVFTGLSFPHHCNTDWILTCGPNLTNEQWRNLTLPVNKGSLTFLLCGGGGGGGAAFLVSLTIPNDLPVVKTVIAVLGKFAVTAAFSIVFVYTPELYTLYTTIVRQNGVGLYSMCAHVGGILAPLIRLLEVYHYTIPMLIYGIIPVAAGCFCLLLPETLNVELQDHIDS
ncbi:hypothetical protein LDENG_00203410 [Lucifuga dentata]|nr:hypothetical protein LDENG_00203410 [Lucifuga dentata]